MVEISVKKKSSGSFRAANTMPSLPVLFLWRSQNVTKALFSLVSQSNFLHGHITFSKLVQGGALSDKPGTAPQWSIGSALLRFHRLYSPQKTDGPSVDGFVSLVPGERICTRHI